MAARPEAAAPESAGRKRTRRLVGIGRRLLAAAVFVPCFLVISWRGEHYFVLLVNLIVLTGLYEFYGLMRAKGLQPHELLGASAGLLLPWAMYLRGGVYAGPTLVVLLIAAMASELWRRRVDQALAHIAVTTFGILYVGWLGGHLVLLRELPRLIGAPYAAGHRFVVFVFLVTWMSDTGAYLVGSLAGRHKLAPRISPSKSVEGACGGLVLAVVAGLCAALTFVHREMTPATGALLGALAALCGQCGDLAESLLKRDASVKDASGAIPGHGGALDRFDSILFAAPLLYYVLRFAVV